MINIDLIKQFADLKKQLVLDGVYGFYQDSLQVSASDLLDFPNVQFETRHDNEQFPFAAFVVVNGIKLFGLMSKEEWYLVNGMSDYMHEDIDLSGGVESAS